MPKGTNVKGFELTKAGMKAMFAQMGYPDIATGNFYNQQATLDQSKLDSQGFMPIQAVSLDNNTAHWLLLIKGKEGHYHLYDPMGAATGSQYLNEIKAKLPRDATLDVIPTEPGLHAGLSGYWVASAGIRARNEIIKDEPPTLETLGKTISQEMKDAVAKDGLLKIKQWLESIANAFKGTPESTPTDASQLRAKAQTTFVSPEQIGHVSLYTDATIREAAQWAYDKHLGTPYKPGNMEATPANLGGVTVYRQTHGLAHTLRTMAYTQVIVEEARKAKLRGETLGKFSDGRTIADVTPEELKKIMIAQAFFVAGREGEESDADNYKKYHELSKKAFLDYVSAHPDLIPGTFKDQTEVNWYADVVEDKGHNWEASPAHVLINQAHMVDLVRVKQPPESFLELYFTAMNRWVGSQATEAVFSIQRDFFRATYENVTAFEFDNPEPHLVVSGLGRHLMKDGQPVRLPLEQGETVGKLKVVQDGYVLQPGESIMKVREYLALPEVVARFPGAGKKLEGGYPGLDYMATIKHTSSKERAKCETNVDFCLQQLQKAHEKANASPLSSLEASTQKERRKATPDEAAAAKIIQQILANPSSVQADHVLLNGERLDADFFRTLLKNCDMSLVASHLEQQDLLNVDALMVQERDTEFHEPGTDPVVTKTLGAEWDTSKAKYTSGSAVENTAQAVVNMMQESSCYSKRMNAVSQGVDKASTFKEIMMSALMMPLTQKALAEIQPKENVEPPKKIFFKMGNLSGDEKSKLLERSEGIIGSSTVGLFTDPKLNIYNQIQMNHFTAFLGKSNLSTAGSEKGANVLGQGLSGESVMLEIDDPNGVLGAQKVSIPNQSSEQGYSVYLPEDVALVPVQITKRTPPDTDILRLVAVKSPDFMPRIESNFAVDPYLKTQGVRLDEIQSSIANDKVTRDANLTNLVSEIEKQSAKPIRGFFARLSHWIMKTDDGMISQERKDFYNTSVLPHLKTAQSALTSNNLEGMEAALKNLPSDKLWGAFASLEAVDMKGQVKAMKDALEKHIAIQRETVPALAQMKSAIDAKDIGGALQSLPEHGAWEHSSQATSLRALREGLLSVQEGVKPSVSEQQRTKQQSRYDALVSSMTEQVAAIEKNTGVYLDNFERAHEQIQKLLPQIEGVKRELKRISPDPNSADLSPLTALEDRLHNFALTKGKILISKIGSVTNIKTASDFAEKELLMVRAFNVIEKLQTHFPDSQEANEQKAKVIEYQKVFADLQKAYPKTAEISLKAEALVVSLRERCVSNLAGLKAPTVSDDSYYNEAWAQLGYERENLTQMKLKYQTLMATKTLLTDISKDPIRVLQELSTKTAKQLEEALGIPSEKATEVLAATKQAFPSPAGKYSDAQVTACLDALDNAMGKFTAPEIRREVVIQLEGRDEDDFRDIFTI